ncbi:MAG: CxxC-x17-CxxC domain-containing protein [Nanoarchaeota archaeon]
MKNFRSGGSNGRSGGFGGGGFRHNFGPREMHKAVCSQCKKDCEVPFKPTEGKPVYCKDCYASKKAEQN